MILGNCLFLQSVPTDLHATRLRSNDEKDDNVGEAGGGGGGGGGRGGERKKEEERDDNFKIRAKTRRKEKKFLKMMMMMKNKVQIHNEQRSIQMIVLYRDTHKNTVQTSTVIINNGSKNSKRRPKSDTQ